MQVVPDQPRAPGVAVDVAGGTAFELLLRLARASAAPAADQGRGLTDALAQVGDRTGETWLNLLGIPLDLGPPYSAERLVAELAAIDAVELRRHLLGRYAWSWCTLAGVDQIEAAAVGDEAASSTLLAHPRYYAAQASESLAVILTLTPAETQRRLSRAVEIGLQSLLTDVDAHYAEEAARTAAEVLDATDPLDAVERLTSGYRYVPEPEAERLVLIPHLARTPRLVLAQHRSARVIAYRARPQVESEERLVALGRAVSDAKRIEILGLLGRGIGQVADLVRHTGLSRSTVHHHLTQLREAGLIVLEGNARAYSYVPRREAAAEAASLLADVAGVPESNR